MIGVGNTLNAIRRAQEARIANQALTVKGGPPTATQQTEILTITVSSVKYPVFIAGVDDPDDTATARYVP